MSHLSVDPGERSGWATWINDGVDTCGIVDGANLNAVSRIIERYSALGTMVIEDQFISTHLTSMGRRKPRNPEGIKTLLYRRHLWEIPAEQNGMKVVTVNPSTWQAYYRIPRGDKDAIVKVAQLLTGRGHDYDEADAVLMAYWYAQQCSGQAKIRGAT